MTKYNPLDDPHPDPTTQNQTELTPDWLKDRRKVLKKDPVQDDQVPADTVKNESIPKFVTHCMESRSEHTVSDTGRIQPESNPETSTPTKLMKEKNTDILTTLLPHNNEINPEDFGDKGDSSRLSGAAFLEDFGNFPFVGREVHERSEDR